MFTDNTQKLNDLINVLILKNKKLFERLPHEFRNHHVYREFGELLNAKRFKGPTSLDYFFSNNQSSNNMIDVVKKLLTINKKIKTDITRVHNAETKRKEEVKALIAKSISTNVNQPSVVSSNTPSAVPSNAPVPVFTNAFFSNSQDYKNKVNSLNSKSIKDIYTILIQVIQHIYQNQKYFMNASKSVMNYNNKNEITFDDIVHNITISTNNQATLELFSYAYILYMYIVYEHFTKYNKNKSITAEKKLGRFVINVVPQITFEHAFYNLKKNGILNQLITPIPNITDTYNLVDIVKELPEDQVTEIVFKIHGLSSYLANASLKITLVNDKTDYDAKVMNLSTMKIDAIYKELETVIKKIFYNQKFFNDSKSKSMQYSNENEITYNDIVNNINELSLKVKVQAQQAAAAPQPVAAAPSDEEKQLYLVSYAFILYMYIVYDFFSIYISDTTIKPSKLNVTNLSNVFLTVTTKFEEIYKNLSSNGGILSNLTRQQFSQNTYNISDIIDKLPSEAILKIIFNVPNLSNQLGTKITKLNINSFNNEAEYMKKVTELDNKQIQDIYKMLVDVIKDIHDNQSFFINKSGSVMNYDNENKITYGDIFKNISQLNDDIDNASSVLVLSPINSSAKTAIPDYKYKHNLVSYAFILYMYIVYNLFQQYAINTPNASQIKQLLLDLINPDSLDNKSTFSMMLNKLNSNNNGIIKLTPQHYNYTETYKLINIVLELPHERITESVFTIHNLQTNLGNKLIDVDAIAVAAAAAASGSGGPGSGAPGSGAPGSGAHSNKIIDDLTRFLNIEISTLEISNIYTRFNNKLDELVNLSTPKKQELQDDIGIPFQITDVNKIKYSDIIVNVTSSIKKSDDVKVLIIEILVLHIYIIYHFYKSDETSLKSQLKISNIANFKDIFETTGGKQAPIKILNIKELIQRLDTSSNLSLNSTKYNIKDVIDATLANMVGLKINQQVASASAAAGQPATTFELAGGGLGKNYEKYMKYKLKYHRLKAQLRIQ
jgi:hypothetical protein